MKISKKLNLLSSIFSSVYWRILNNLLLLIILLIVNTVTPKLQNQFLVCEIDNIDECNDVTSILY